jgi:hypothetical protein
LEHNHESQSHVILEIKYHFLKCHVLYLYHTLIFNQLLHSFIEGKHKILLLSELGGEELHDLLIVARPQFLDLDGLNISVHVVSDLSLVILEVHSVLILCVGV